MPSPSPWPDAALAGLACSMRSMSGPAALAGRGRFSGRPRTALLLAGAGELVADKTPWAIDRIAKQSLIGRVITGTYTGAVLGGPAGALVAAASAYAGTWATWRLRKLVVSASGLADPVVAVGEDILCYAIAGGVTRNVTPR